MCVKKNKNLLAALPAAFLLTATSLVTTDSVAAEWRGNVTADYLWFARDAAFPKQEESYVSAAIEPEFFS